MRFCQPATITSDLWDLRQQEVDRRAAYNADVTYVTNSELGFDYLRDNLAQVMQAHLSKSKCSYACMTWAVGLVPCIALSCTVTGSCDSL